MNIVWISFHEEAFLAFHAVLKKNKKISAFITLDDEAFAKKSAGIRAYKNICEEYHIPYITIPTIKSDEAFEIISSYHPDLLIVLGWSEILPERLLKVPVIGTVGAHASLLPHNRGSAPINWALIHGEKRTGNTLMWLNAKVDEGAIIDQMEFPITMYDSCQTLYKKVAETNSEMLLQLIKKLEKGFKPINSIENITDEPLLPRRRPKDGFVNWNKSGMDIYNFIRALTHPYPGAFTYLEGRKWILWKAALLPFHSSTSNLKPGEILDYAYSFSNDANGLLVGTTKEILLITEMEDMEGNQYSGKSLNELNLKGVFGYE